MHKLNVLLVAALLAGAAVLGTIAVLRTTAHRPTSDAAAVRARTAQLNRFEAQLRRQLAKQPPALPAAPRPVAPRVVYRRPPAVVVVRHLAHGDDGGEHEGGGGDD